jgi:hypothetical protein
MLADAVGVRPPVVLRPRLTFGVRLDEKAAEVGNQAIDFCGLGLPPLFHGRICRIGRLQAADLDRRREPDREKHADSVRTQHVGQCRSLFEVIRPQTDRIRVDVGEHRCIDAQRSICARIVDVARIDVVGKLVPIPDRLACIAALDAAIRIVPMIEDAEAKRRRLLQFHCVERLAGLQQAQQVKDAVQDANIVLGSNDQRAMSTDGSAANRIALRAGCRQRQLHPRQHWQRTPRPYDERAILRHARRVSERDAQQSPKPTL